MENKKPKLEFKTNLPQKFIFVKMFKQGESEFNGKKSKWFGCSVKQGDIEKTLFATEPLWNKMNKATEGDTVEATLAEIHGDDGKAHKEWQVTINGVEQGISKTKDIAETEERKQDYIKEKQSNEHERNNGMKWGNALNCASLLIANGVYSEYKTDETLIDNIHTLANDIYALTPPLFDTDGNLKGYEGTPYAD